MLAVNNSKNPVRDAKSSAKHNKVGEDAGSCCNHGKNPRGGVGGYGLLLRVASSCNVAPKNHTDVPRHDEQTKCNSSLHLGRGTWSLFRQGCHHQAPGTTPGRQTSIHRVRH